MRKPVSPVVNLVLLVATFLTVSWVGWLFSRTDDQLPATMTGLLLSFPEFLNPATFAGSLPESLPFSVSILAILGSHEMGHYLACRFHGIPATLPFFIPGIPPFGTFGAVIRIRGAIPDRRALFDMAAAGPLAGFAVALPILLYGVHRADALPEIPPGAGMGLGDSLLSHLLWMTRGDGGHWQVGSIYYAAWFGMLVTSMNLFPVGQLDGGHVAYALGRKLHRFLSWTTISVLGLFVLFHGITTLMPSVYTLWCLILLWMRDRHPRVVREAIGLGPARTALALVLFALFVLTFIPIPFVF